MANYLVRGDYTPILQGTVVNHVAFATGLNATMISTEVGLSFDVLNGEKNVGGQVYELLSNPWQWENGRKWSWDKDTRRLV